MTKTKFTEKPAKGQMGLALNYMENCVETLTANQTTRCQLEHEGQLLLERVASEGMDERLLEECLDHVARCARTRNEMHERRRPFTDALQQLQKRFVAEENAIDPQKRDTPAFTLVAHARSYYQARLDEAAERERQLTRNREATGRRVERRKDWSDEQKQAALQRADARLIEGRRAAVATPSRAARRCRSGRRPRSPCSACRSGRPPWRASWWRRCRRSAGCRCPCRRRGRSACHSRVAPRRCPCRRGRERPRRWSRA